MDYVRFNSLSLFISWESQLYLFTAFLIRLCINVWPSSFTNKMICAINMLLPRFLQMIITFLNVLLRATKTYRTFSHVFVLQSYALKIIVGFGSKSGVLGHDNLRFVKIVCFGYSPHLKVATAKQLSINYQHHHHNIGDGYACNINGCCFQS